MRKLIYSINFSIDACCDHTKMTGSDEVLAYFAQQMRDTGVLLYGRITYQLMVPFWPDVHKDPSGKPQPMTDFAEAFSSVGEIVVVSKTLEKTERKNDRIIRSDLRAEILRLKQEQGKDIYLGGVDLPAQLIGLGLVDEYRFVLHPVFVGGGRRLLDGIDLAENLKLKLVDSKPLGSGYLALHYSK